jgi:hypothetical protein
MVATSNDNVCSGCDAPIVRNSVKAPTNAAKAAMLLFLISADANRET